MSHNSDYGGFILGAACQGDVITCQALSINNDLFAQPDCVINW